MVGVRRKKRNCCVSYWLNNSEKYRFGGVFLCNNFCETFYCEIGRLYAVTLAQLHIFANLHIIRLILSIILCIIVLFVGIMNMQRRCAYER